MLIGSFLIATLALAFLAGLCTYSKWLYPFAAIFYILAFYVCIALFHGGDIWKSYEFLLGEIFLAIGALAVVTVVSSVGCEFAYFLLEEKAKKPPKIEKNNRLLLEDKSSQSV